MAHLSSSPVALLLIVAVLAAVWDLRTGEIPNRLLAIGALGCIASALGAGLLDGGAGLLRALSSVVLGVLLVSLVPVLLFRAGGIGGGDVKLLALVGASLGPTLGLEAELWSFVAAMLYAPARLIWDGRLVEAGKTTLLLAVRPLMPQKRRPEIPLEALTSLRFAPAILAGVLTALLHQLGAAR